MKILYLCSSSSLGGSGIALLHILTTVCAQGHEVMVVMSEGNGPLTQKFRELGCHIRVIPFRSSLYPLSKNPILYIPRVAYMAWTNYKAQKELGKVLTEFSPDIVHTNVGVVNIGVHECVKRNIPHIWHHREYHDLHYQTRYFPCNRIYYRDSHCKGNFNIAITKEMFSYRKFRTEVDRVIYDGVFPVSENHLSIPHKREKMVLFVGRVEPGKGTLELIQAFIRFHKGYPDYKLFIVGNIAQKYYYKQCMQLVQQHQLENKISFLGACNNVSSYMQKASMLVVPSRYEAFGFVTVEGMLNFCPVIGKNTGGTKEQFDIGLQQTGSEIGLRYLSQKELLTCMERVIKEDMTQMCKDAYNVVKSHYTIEHASREVLDYYHFVLNHQ